MQSLEAACEEAEHLLHIATKCPQFVPCLADQTGKPSFDIHARLRQLYLEESSRDLQQPQKHLRLCSHLLEKLVAREQLNTVVVSLYPGDKGFSLAFKAFNKQSASTEEMIETDRISYGEDQLLAYIDNEELPAELADLLEPVQPCLFYCGCVVAEVRDYRQAFPHFVCDVRHVLLKPSTSSLVGAVNQLAGEEEWSAEERALLESQLVLATESALCLDASPSLLVAYNRLQYQHRALNTTALRKCARKFSQASVNRKRKLEQLPSRCSLPLQDFLSRRKSKPRTTVPVSNAKLPKKCLLTVTRDTANLKVPVVVQPCDNGLPAPPCAPVPLEALAPELGAPGGGVFPAQLARAYERPRDTADCTPQLVEEFVLETDRPQGQVYHVKISIYQRPSGAEYLGEMYVDRDYRKDRRNGTSCRFTLGSRAHVNRYIHQFTEVFTEEGSKSVRITQMVPGQPARMSSTAAMKEREAKAAALQAQLQAQQQLQHLQAQLQARSQPSSVVSPPPPQPSLPSPAPASFQPSFTSGTAHSSSLAPSVPVTESVSQSSAGGGPSKTSRLASNPAISALVTSLMNSAHEFQQKAAAAAAAAANSSGAPPPANPTILGLLNNGTAQGGAASAQGNLAILGLLNSGGAPGAGQPGLARKRTWSLVNSRLVNNAAAGSGAPTQQPPSLQPAVRPCVSTSSLMQPGSTAGVSPKGPAATLNHASRTNSSVAVTAAGSTPKMRRLSGAAQGDSGSTAASGLGLSVPGLCALLAGSPSADNPIPGATSNTSALLERLTSERLACPSSRTPPSPYSCPPAASPSPKGPALTPSPLSSPPQPPSQPSVNVNLQRLSLASLQGLQNVQVSIPGLAVPISLLLNVPGAAQHSGVIVTTLPVTTCTATCTTTTSVMSSAVSVGAGTNSTMVLSNSVPTSSGTPLSLPVAQLVASGLKGLNAQTLRTIGSNASVSVAQGTNPSIQLTLQRPRSIAATKNKPVLTTAGILNPQRLKITSPSVVSQVSVATLPTTASQPGTAPALTAQQQLHLALQKKQAQLQQQCLLQDGKAAVSPAALATKHRRRSSAADPNK
ncbi:transcription factor SPT20 homolog isoform X2 [Bacillus rossius redtenbacheri]|uniref:transcription factor SPT20 homolog isoform X2 n=1 Tax=Bacillus rossius redtenbacheri TaxID=93214 RepID=UPI002FDD32BF